MNNQTQTMEEVMMEKETYKVAFETVTKYLNEYSKSKDDGGILLDLILYATDLDDDNIDAFILIEQAIRN